MIETSNLCMLCSKPALDAKHVVEFDGESFWYYCRECDVWTSHPFVTE
jgi:hypothetical protein